jgi:hypothetical protein
MKWREIIGLAIIITLILLFANNWPLEITWG